MEGQAPSVCRKRSAAKGVRSLFFVFGMLSVTFRSLFLTLLSLFPSLFCQTPFAGLLLRQGDFLEIEGRESAKHFATLWPRFSPTSAKNFARISLSGLFGASTSEEGCAPKLSQICREVESRFLDNFVQMPLFHAS